MFLFSHSVTPAVRTHLNAQAAFMNDMSKSMSRSFQELFQLNMQLSQTLLEESTIIAHQMLTTDRPNEVVSVTAGRAQPASDKLRAYQQHISRVAADAQVELARVAEQHVQETSRTARELADAVARTAAEETDRNMRQQEEAMKSFRDPFQNGAQRGNGGAQHGTMQHSGSQPGSMQAAGMGSNGSARADSERTPLYDNLQSTQRDMKAGKPA